MGRDRSVYRFSDREKVADPFLVITVVANQYIQMEEAAGGSGGPSLENTCNIDHATVVKSADKTVISGECVKNNRDWLGYPESQQRVELELQLSNKGNIKSATYDNILRSWDVGTGSHFNCLFK